MPTQNPGTDMKDLLRRYPTGVTIVTSTLDGLPYGGTMNSFTSVSLNPPLIAVFITEGSKTSDAILESGKFNVNILKHDQEAEARTFSSPGENQRFSSHGFNHGENGMPVLQQALGYLECNLFRSEKIADHIMFVGEVTKAQVISDEDALVYYRRAFKPAS